jgi:competence protein ComFC
MCESLSLSHICPTCRGLYLKPSIFKRKIQNTDVISFYKYSEIKDLLHTKHTDLGYYIYNILAKEAFEKFAKEFVFEHQLVSVAVDDRVKSGYAHTAILNKALKCKSIKPLFNKLKATNDISYSKKSREFRMNNPRDFKLSEFEQNELILVDDIITTGSTLSQAISLLKAHKKEVLFCLTLADVSQK